MKNHTLALNFWRIWLPAALCLIGITVLIADGFNLFGTDAFAGFCGAGLSIALTNILWRIGITGNLDRDDEEDARQYLARHGHWPSEDQTTPQNQTAPSRYQRALSDPSVTPVTGGVGPRSLPQPRPTDR